MPTIICKTCSLEADTGLTGLPGDHRDHTLVCKHAEFSDDDHVFDNIWDLRDRLRNYYLHKIELSQIRRDARELKWSQHVPKTAGHNKLPLDQESAAALRPVLYSAERWTKIPDVHHLEWRLSLLNRLHSQEELGQARPDSVKVSTSKRNRKVKNTPLPVEGEAKRAIVMLTCKLAWNKEHRYMRPLIRIVAVDFLTSEIIIDAPVHP